MKTGEPIVFVVDDDPAMREAARNYQIPIILVTSYDSDDARIQAAEGGAVGFLCKPFSQESLVRAVRSGLESQRKDRS